MATSSRDQSVRSSSGPRPRRWPRAAAVAVLLALWLVVVAVLSSGSSLQPTIADPQAAPPAATPAARTAPTSTNRVGQNCETADLVMMEGAEPIYCEDDGFGNLVWATGAD